MFPWHSVARPSKYIKIQLTWLCLRKDDTDRLSNLDYKDKSPFVDHRPHESPMSQRAFVVRYFFPRFLAMRNQCGNDTRYVQILKTNLFTLPFVMDFGWGTDKI